MTKLKEVPRQRLFRISAAARYLGISRDLLRKYSDLGEIPAKRMNVRRMFVLEELDKWIASRPEWTDSGPRAVHQ